MTETQGTRTHIYKTVNCSFYGGVEMTANIMAERGWRVVAAIGARGTSYADQLIFERPVNVVHPDD